jgi:hypothetical protein
VVLLSSITIGSRKGENSGGLNRQLSTIVRKNLTGMRIEGDDFIGVSGSGIDSDGERVGISDGWGFSNRH